MRHDSPTPSTGAHQRAMARAIPKRLRTPGEIIWTTGEEFLADRCPQMAAAISFYTLFSLPPLLVLLIMLIEPWMSPEVVIGWLEEEVGGLIGPQGSAQLLALVENARRPGQGGPIPAILGIGAFLFGATAAFGQLQAALNAAWQVGPNPERGDVRNFLAKRVLSFLMIVAIGVLLVTLLLFSTLLGAFGDTLEAIDPRLPSGEILRGIDVTTSFSILTFTFAAMFRYLPDAKVTWRAALRGGVITALLFTAGKVGLGYYLGTSDPGSAFGAAGSLALVLIWIYYSSMILLLGAEITQVWMRWRGEPIRPREGAVRVILKTEHYRPAEEPVGDPDVKQ
jgi:membrane protein